MRTATDYAVTALAVLATIIVNAIARLLVWAVTRGAPARVH